MIREGERRRREGESGENREIQVEDQDPGRWNWRSWRGEEENKGNSRTTDLQGSFGVKGECVEQLLIDLKKTRFRIEGGSAQPKCVETEHVQEKENVLEKIDWPNSELS